MYASGYVAVSESGSGGLFDRSFPSGILDKVNSDSVCFHCNQKLRDHLNFKEKVSKLDPNIMIKIDEYFPEGIAMKDWLDKSQVLVKRKSIKPR